MEFMDILFYFNNKLKHTGCSTDIYHWFGENNTSILSTNNSMKSHFIVSKSECKRILDSMALRTLLLSLGNMLVNNE